MKIRSSRRPDPENDSASTTPMLIVPPGQANAADAVIDAALSGAWSIAALLDADQTIPKPPIEMMMASSQKPWTPRTPGSGPTSPAP
jgi:hypothetical protein